MIPTVLKLVSGETLIADVSTSTTPNCFEISDPLVMRGGIGPNNKFVMSLMPWMETDQRVFTIRSEHIISKAPPTQIVQEHYELYKQTDMSEEEDYDDEYDPDDMSDERIVH